MFFLHSCKVNYEEFFQVSSLLAIPQFWLWYINLAILLSFDFQLALIITRCYNCSQHVKHINLLQSLISIVALFLLVYFPVSHSTYSFNPTVICVTFLLSPTLRCCVNFVLSPSTQVLLATLSTLLLLFLIPPILLFCHW